MVWDPWIKRWNAALQACNRLGGEARLLRVERPAADAEVFAVERELGLKLPGSLREVLTGFAHAVEFGWYLPLDRRFPPPFHEIFGGNFSWDLGQLVRLEQTRREWIARVFSDPSDPYDRVWHEKLAFMEVPNGDLLAVDLARPGAPVVYLSHDDGAGHGYLLGRDFADFIDRWSTLGCPGPEDWQMLPFLGGPTSLLEVTGTNARAWRQAFKLPAWP